MVTSRGFVFFNLTINKIHTYIKFKKKKTFETSTKCVATDFYPGKDELCYYILKVGVRVLWAARTTA